MGNKESSSLYFNLVVLKVTQKYKKNDSKLKIKFIFIFLFKKKKTLQAMINVKINGNPYKFPKNMTILEACKSANIYIPTLCFHEDIPASGKCGLCIVRINGNSFTYACVHKMTNGMTIETNTPEVMEKVRRDYTNFIDSPIPPQSKDIEEILNYLYPRNNVRSRESDHSNSISFDPSLCINCGRCTRMCSDVQNVGAFNYLNPRVKDNECISCGQCLTVCPTGALNTISSKSSILKAIVDGKILVLQMAPAARVAIAEAFGNPPGTVATGKIIQAAREVGFKYVFDTNFGADITVIEEGNELLRRLNINVDEQSILTQDSPLSSNLPILPSYNHGNISSSSSLYSTSDSFSLSTTTPVKQTSPKVINTSHRSTFHSNGIVSPNIKKVSSMIFNLKNMRSSSNSNLSHLAEQPHVSTPKHHIEPSHSTSLLSKIEPIESSALPQFTSCCPAWVNYVEKLHPELIPNLSTTKSPHMIVGKLVKTYFAKVINARPEDIFLVSLMPCVAKKDEIKRMQLAGDVDAVMTSKEFVEYFKDFGVSFNELNSSEFDSILGESSGAGQIFGTTGGVAEATVRYIHKIITHEQMHDNIEYESFRGMKSIKTATVEVGNNKINIAICNGISAVGELIDSDKLKKFHFIEVMACPGGCVGGAGQPYLPKKNIQDRIQSIFQIDREKKIRISDESSEVCNIYTNFLGHPGSPIAHELLHTHYEPQETAILAQRRRMLSMPVVAYGSSSGTAMKLSRTVADIIGSSSVAMNRLSIKELMTRKIAIFIISTIGEGEFPVNSRKFIEKLEDSAEDLSGVKYAVVGLGCQRYTYYCQAGIELDAKLEQHRAHRIFPLQKIDTSTEDKGEAIFEGWCFRLCEALGLKPPKIEIHLNYQMIPVEDQTIASNPLRPVGFEIASLKTNEKLTPEELNDTNLQMNFIQIKIPKGVMYSTGDVLEILPENEPDLVDKAIEALKLDPEQVYSLILNDSSFESFVPEKITTRQLFSQYLDLNGSPNRSIIRAFLEVSNQEGIARLTKMLEVPQPDDVINYLKDVNTCEFICEFAQFGIPSIETILSSCPHIKPRSYFIASSPIRNQNMVNLIVTRRRFGKNSKRKGLCTTYLQSEELKKVPIRITQGSFELPENRHAPMILVAIGCGIAPMLSLIQNKGSQNGPILLIYGSTSSKINSKLMDELEKEKENGALADVLYAWSDEDILNKDISELGSNQEIEKKTEEKILEVMKKNTTLIWNYWSDVTTTLYYCGIPGPLSDKLKELLLKITIEEGYLSIEEAMATNNRHQVFVEVF